jgi:hypothetical protein
MKTPRKFGTTDEIIPKSKTIFATDSWDSWDLKNPNI